MIVDTSALLAIVFQETGYEDVLDRILSAPVVAAGSPTLAEAGIVLHARLGAGGHGLLERLLDELAIEEISFGSLHWRETVEAYRTFGKGQNAAGLNFGDCMTYAVARLSGEPLLFVGHDFPKTDLESA
ncbi:MAG: type II toxin-antitoxin system VapC family toxin [Dehalococcoidia bacterium]